MLTSRRSLLGGIGALLVAPSIVRAGSLMPVKVPPLAINMLPPLVSGRDMTDHFRSMEAAKDEIWQLVMRLCQIRDPWGRA